MNDALQSTGLCSQPCQPAKCEYDNRWESCAFRGREGVRGSQPFLCLRPLPVLHCRYKTIGGIIKFRRKMLEITVVGVSTPNEMS